MSGLVCVRFCALLFAFSLLTHEVASFRPFHQNLLGPALSTRRSKLCATSVDGLTVAELKEKLKERGLPVTGLKAILIKRLQESQLQESGSSSKSQDVNEQKQKTQSIKPPLSQISKEESKKKATASVISDLDDLESLMLEGEKLLSQASTATKSSSQQFGKQGGGGGGGGGDGGGLTFDIDTVQALVDERHQFRMVRDFESADAIVDRLRQDYGVEIQSSRGVWIARDGTKGPLSPDGFSTGSGTGSDRLSGSPSTPLKILASNENCRLTKAQIQKLVDERTQNRRKRFFNEADKLRDSLASEGVELLDGEDIWRTTNGQLQGSQSNIDKSRWRDR